MVQSQRVVPADSLLYKSLATAYTLLLGLVLPFICWGTLATSNHPHRMAHLVFFMPPMPVETPAQGGDADHEGHLRQDDGKQNSSATQPVGRSVPDELASAISIISPLFLVQILLIFSPTLLTLRMSQTTAAHLFDPRVLTPPPRRLYL
jgi:hypothetical protein